MNGRTIAGLCAAAVLAAGVRAQVKFDPPAADFGRKPQNQTFSTTIRVTNAGPVPVRILKADTDCGCTTAVIAASTLAPGQSESLVVTIQSGAAEGPVSHSVFLTTEPGGTATLPVRMLVYHYENWIVTPPRVVMAPSVRGTPVSAEVRLDYLGNGPLKPTQVSSDSNWFEVKPGATSSKSVIYYVTKLPGAPDGAAYATIRVATGDPVSPQLDIPVFAYVKPPVEVDPNPIVMPSVKAGTPAVATARMTGWDDFRQLRAELADGTVGFEGAKAGVMTLKLTLRSAPAGYSEHKLAIYDGAKLIVEVPVLERAN
jgi:hypothetical protein